MGRGWRGSTFRAWLGLLAWSWSYLCVCDLFPCLDWIKMCLAAPVPRVSPSSWHVRSHLSWAQHSALGCLNKYHDEALTTQHIAIHLTLLCQRWKSKSGWGGGGGEYSYFHILELLMSCAALIHSQRSPDHIQHLALSPCLPCVPCPRYFSQFRILRIEMMTVRPVSAFPRSQWHGHKQLIRN